MEVKIFNPIIKNYQKLKLSKVETGSLPYRLAFEKFLRFNNISISSLSFQGVSVLQDSFNKIYNY